MEKKDFMNTELMQSAATVRLYDDYCAIFFVNLDTNKAIAGRLTESFERILAENFESDEAGVTYDRSVSYVASNLIAPMEKTRFLYSMSRDAILSKFKREPIFFLKFSAIVDGEIIHYQNKFASYTDENGNRCAVLGVKNVENTARIEMQRQEQSTIISKLMDNYDCIILANVETESMSFYRVNGYVADFINRHQSMRTFDERRNFFAEEIVSEDDRERFLSLTKTEIIAEALNTNATHHVNYKAIINGVTEYYQLKFIRNDTDSSKKTVIIGIHNVDTEYKNNEQRYEQAAIISGLTNDYDCIAYVDLKTDNIKFYKKSSELASFLPTWSEETSFSSSMKAFASLIRRHTSAEAFLKQMSSENIFCELASEHVISGKLILRLGNAEVYYDYKLVPDSRSNGCVILGFANTDAHTREDLRRHELESLTTARHEFLSRMSHDIRTPINGVIGMLEIAKRSVGDNAKTEDALEKVETAAHHLFSLVDDVLDMTRIESGSAKLKKEPMDMRVLINAFMSIAEGQLIGRKLEFIDEFQEFKHPFLLSDELRIRQILLNITNNAIKFTPDGGTIHVRGYEVELPDDGSNMTSYRFEIEDNGIGMKPEFIEHLFEAFTQEASDARTTYHGTGLGMSITKKYVEMFGATIDVESTPNVGSCFTVTFPLEIDTTRTTSTIIPAELSMEHITTLEGTRLLIVEDNEINMEIAKTLLEEEGAIVTTAENGKIGLDTFIEAGPKAFDAILMDIMMPVMDGLEATRQIRSSGTEDAKRIPIIALTANAFDEDRRKVLDAGMNAHLTKPLDIRTLVKTLTYYIVK